MTKTLQDKIDNLLPDGISFPRISLIDVNQAIQELREEIEKRSPKCPHKYQDYCCPRHVVVEEILALIGEKA